MATAICEGPLDVNVNVEGMKPSMSLSGRANSNNMTNVVEMLSQLVDQHDSCVSLDLGGLESMDTGAITCLADSAVSFKDRQRRPHLKCASDPVNNILERLLISDLFCSEGCCENCDPIKCGTASRAWDIDVFTLPCQMQHGREARKRVDSIAEAVGMNKCRRSDLMLAVGEAVANAINYGHCDSSESIFTVSCLGTADKISVTVSDNGNGFDLSNIPAFKEATMLEHGRGIFCMKSAMDEVSYSFEAGTTVRMVKSTK